MESFFKHHDKISLIKSKNVMSTFGITQCSQSKSYVNYYYYFLIIIM